LTSTPEALEEILVYDELNDDDGDRSRITSAIRGNQQRDRGVAPRWRGDELAEVPLWTMSNIRDSTATGRAPLERWELSEPWSPKTSVSSASSCLLCCYPTDMINNNTTGTPTLNM
jgi:hypothetical protein